MLAILASTIREHERIFWGLAAGCFTIAFVILAWPLLGRIRHNSARKFLSQNVRKIKYEAPAADRGHASTKDLSSIYEEYESSNNKKELRLKFPPDTDNYETDAYLSYVIFINVFVVLIG